MTNCLLYAVMLARDEQADNHFVPFPLVRELDGSFCAIFKQVYFTVLPGFAFVHADHLQTFGETSGANRA